MIAIDVGKTIRINRFFRTNKALLVPIDDSFIAGPEGGLEDISHLISCIDSSDATGIMMTYGSYIRNYDIIQNTPCLLNVSASTVLSNHTRKVLVQDVLEALKVGLSGVACHINLSSKYESEMLKIAAEIGAQCRELSVPFMIISYPRKEMPDGFDCNYTGLSIQEYTKMIKHCVRVAVELGADMIKTHYTGTADSFREVIRSAEGVPVLVSGSSMMNLDALIEKVYGAISAGASGVCFGRNVFNSPDPQKTIKAISNAIWNC